MKNRAIYSILSTDGLNHYIVANRQMFGLETDADGNEIPDATYESVVREVVANATDGRLEGMIALAFQGHHADAVMDDVYSQIDKYVYDEVNIALKRRRTDCYVAATVALQRWHNDYAVTVTEIGEFDCQAALDTFELSALPPYSKMIHGNGWLNHGDDIFSKCVRLGIIDDWDGPFEFYIADDDAYDRYIRKRVHSEYGVELRNDTNTTN